MITSRTNFSTHANSVDLDKTAPRSLIWIHTVCYRLRHYKMISRWRTADYIKLRLAAEGAQWLSGRDLDSRPRGRGFEPHRRHCVVSLSKPHLSLLSTGSTKEGPSRYNWKIADWDVRNQNKKKLAAEELTYINTGITEYWVLSLSLIKKAN